MIYRIDPTAAEPIFAQIAGQIIDGVVRGRLAEGDRLPSVRELARELAVNPNTVIKAYDQLEQLGVIIRRQGAGCFLTGQTHRLSGRERRSALTALVRRLAGDATRLGFAAEEIESALAKELARQAGANRKPKP